MITGILLAAGQGSRFGGGNKLLYPLADGTPMAVAAARNLLSALPQSLAVIRAEDRELARLLSAEGMEVVVNHQADQGMGVSLAWGVKAAAQAQGWVIALADMPFIRPATIQGIVHQLAAGATLVAPAYAGKRGHPVAFGRVFRTPLEKLQGDHGARLLLRQHADQLHCLVVDDPGILVDIDQV